MHLILQMKKSKPREGLWIALNHSLLAAKLGLGPTSSGDSDEKVGFSSVIFPSALDSPNIYCAGVLGCIVNSSS